MASVVKLSSLKADLAREAAGDEVESLRWPGVKFRVSALTKPSYVIKRDAMVARLRRRHKGKSIPQEELGPALGRIYAEEILHGWAGMDEAYTPALALEVLTDPAYREIVSEVEYCAGTLSEIDAEFVEDASKNSVKPSAGSSKSGT